MVLAGPIVCGMSQAANDWCDRHVDAVNEPHRPIPSGRIPGRWGLWIALAMTVLSLAVGWLLGPWGFGATVVGVIAALALFFAQHVLWPQGFGGRFDVVAAALGTTAAVALFRYKVRVVRLILACGAAGLVLRLTGLH